MEDLMSSKEMEDTLYYQDYIVRNLFYKLGWAINQLASKRCNIEIGESMAGVEIKQDKKMADTGNIYIETAEIHFGNSFVPSGVNRKDNTIFYCIGNWDTAYIFVKKQLKYLCDNYHKLGFKYTETPTSKGILIPLSYFDKHPLYVVAQISLGV